MLRLVDWVVRCSVETSDTMKKKTSHPTFVDATFRKMRLVPIGDTAKLQKSIRHYDPLVASMATHLGAMNQKAHSAVAKGSAARLAVQNAHMRRFKALQVQREEQLMPAAVLPTIQPPAEVSVPEPPQAAALPEVQVPRMFHKKLGKLLNRMSEKPGIVGRSDADELVLDGVVQRGTSFSGAMRSLYVNMTVPSPGTRQLVGALRNMGVPKSLLSSKAALGFYGHTGKGLRFPGTVPRVLRVY